MTAILDSFIAAREQAGSQRPTCGGVSKMPESQATHHRCMQVFVVCIEQARPSGTGKFLVLPTQDLVLG